MMRNCALDIAERWHSRWTPPLRQLSLSLSNTGVLSPYGTLHQLTLSLYYSELRPPGPLDPRSRKNDQSKCLCKELGPPNIEKKELNILNCPLNTQDLSSLSDKMSKLILIMSLCAIICVYANNGIPENYFTDSQGIQAADAGAPFSDQTPNPIMP